MPYINHKLLGVSLITLSFSLNGYPAQAETCLIPPSCSQLGYTKKVDDCQGQDYLRCPLEPSNNNTIYCFKTSLVDLPTTSPCIEYIKATYPEAVFVSDEGGLSQATQSSAKNKTFVLLNDISVLNANQIGDDSSVNISSQFAFNSANANCINKSTIYNAKAMVFAPLDVNVKLNGSFKLEGHFNFNPASSGSEIHIWGRKNITINKGATISIDDTNTAMEGSTTANVLGTLKLTSQEIWDANVDGYLEATFQKESVSQYASINITANGSAKIKYANPDKAPGTHIQIVKGGCLNGYVTSRSAGINRVFTAQELDNIATVTDEKGVLFDQSCAH